MRGQIERPCRAHVWLDERRRWGRVRRGLQDCGRARVRGRSRAGSSWGRREWRVVGATASRPILSISCPKWGPPLAACASALASGCGPGEAREDKEMSAERLSLRGRTMPSILQPRRCLPFPAPDPSMACSPSSALPCHSTPISQTSGSPTPAHVSSHIHRLLREYRRRRQSRSCASRDAHGGRVTTLATAA